MVIDVKQTVQAPPYMRRIQKAKERVLSTKPSVDLENARILTESFMKTEGEPLAVRKAKGFREQCQRKTIAIWDDELIVGCAGSRLKACLLSKEQINRQQRWLSPSLHLTMPGIRMAAC